MKSLLRGIAALLIVVVLPGVAATPAAVPARQALSSERDQASYMVGMDIAGTLTQIGGDIDLAAFERAVRHALDGGKPLLSEDEAKATGQALMLRVAAGKGQAVPGMAPGSVPAAPARDKVGLLVGADIGRSLAPIKADFDLPVMMQALRTVLAKGKPLLSDAQATAVRKTFSERIQVRMQAEAGKAALKNADEGRAFLATNQEVKGVFTTPSGLQYMVLRQGAAGRRPLPSDRVRVHYKGALLDGTVFDSSYDRGEPTEFALNQVIPGWTEGLGMMAVGAKYRFWIPGNLAYGDKGTPGGPIGPNATLVFDIELLAIP